MVRELSVVEPEGAKLGQKRKRVAFDPGCDEVANTRRKTGGSSPGDTQARGGENGAEPSSFVIAQQTDYLALKLKSMVNKLVAKRDIAGLRQCVTLMGCIEERGNPSHSSALAPYLSISSKKDADPRACNGKLRGILVSSPLSPIIFKRRGNLTLIGLIPQPRESRRPRQPCSCFHGPWPARNRPVHRDWPH